MRKFKFTLYFSIILLILNLFPRFFEKIIADTLGKSLLEYALAFILLGIYIFIISRRFYYRHRVDYIRYFLPFGILLFLIPFRSVLLYQINTIEFLLLGILVSHESTYKNAILPVLFILLSAVFIEIELSVVMGTSFFYMDVFVNILAGFSGYTLYSYSRE